MAEHSAPTIRDTDICKICGNLANLAFSLPIGKLTGHPIPDEANDCHYFQCSVCSFCYTRDLDNQSHETIYDENYWTTQDPDWYGRVGQTLRLVALANELRQGHLPDLEILDFGCGAGGFLERGQREFSLNVWGADIIPPRLGVDRYLSTIEGRSFDIIVACEVIEHLPDPKGTFAFLKAHLKPHGVIAFQTAYWDPASQDRTWWYIGPGNGHISLYSAGAFDALFAFLGGKERTSWNYIGVQAWQFDKQAAEKPSSSYVRRLLRKARLTGRPDLTR